MTKEKVHTTWITCKWTCTVNNSEIEFIAKVQTLATVSNLDLGPLWWRGFSPLQRLTNAVFPFLSLTTTCFYSVLDGGFQYECHLWEGLSQQAAQQQRYAQNFHIQRKINIQHGQISEIVTKHLPSTAMVSKNVMDESRLPSLSLNLYIKFIWSGFLWFLSLNKHKNIYTASQC